MKKKNSAKRRLLSAAGMLAISAAMLSSATFAWFTMNKTVTVDGMQLTAKADSTYLIIGPENTAAGLQAQNRKDYTFNPATSLEVFPSAHTVDVTNTATASAITAGASAGDPSTVTNWYFKYADAPTASAATENARLIDSEKFNTDYVLHETVYVTLAKGSESATNLRCTNAEFTMTNVKTGESETNDAVTVLVTSASGKDEEDVGSNFTRTGAQLAASVDDQTAIPLDIWIYYNGNDNSVYTNNVANLEGAQIKLTFDVDYTPNYTT